MREWRGIPEFDNPPKEVRKITVHFETEEAVAEFFDRIGQNDNRKKSVWFPPRRHRNLEAVRWKSDED